ncbi:MAG: general secretion pathway protein K [Cocleimonas sp.]|jgi:general secretion pathway protein K
MYTKPYKRPNQKKQKGVALITALIITSVAVSLATLIIYRQQIQIRLSSNISTLEQNYQYAYGMEDFAGTILKRSWEDQPGFVSLNDDWYSESGLILPITGGVMIGKLYDLQSRINVNSLIRPRIQKKKTTPSFGGSGITNSTEPENEDTTQDNNNNAVTTEKEFIDIASVTKDRLKRLIFSIDTQQEMGPEDNFAIVLRDWIDNDQNNGQSSDRIDENDIGNGAETPYYQSLEPAYYSANTEMISPTELRLIKNMKEKFYTTITNEISTLPTLFGDKATETPININTASEKVLTALGFTPDAISNIIEVRKEDPFTSLVDLQTSPVISNALISENNPDGLVDPLDIDVKSEYFLLEGKVEINNTRLFVNSILWRNQNGQVSVIMRDFSNPQTITKATN